MLHGLPAGATVNQCVRRTPWSSIIGSWASAVARRRRRRERGTVIDQRGRQELGHAHALRPVLCRGAGREVTALAAGSSA
jgi:hypothetical protein